MMTRKLSALTRVSSLAVAASLTAAAAGQSLLGTPTVTFGSANITEGTGTTDVDVFSSSAVIDWTPDDNLVGDFGAIAFQNSGTTATFRGFEGDYAVLNRINVADNSRKIFMNGTIQSFINQSVGGDIFFYSPSGFVIGANAAINVGSLVLSASPITVDANGGFISNGLVTFAQADPGASITTVAGSQINALAEGSYVALVAPRVEHNGAIAVNGAAALVGAEAATINFRTDGLFDITVNLGTTDANGVVVGGTGSITGPASGGAGDNHRAYLVAVPKNTAMTMLISSGADLGFDIAGAADVQGNTVILSAGHDVAFGNIDGSQSFASGADADMTIENANFTSAVDGRANGDLTASSVGGSLAFASDAALTGRDLVKLEAGGGGNVSVDGNLTLSASASGDNQGESAQAGNVTLQAFAGGQLSVTGDTVLTATGSGGFSSTEGVGSGDGRGGTILVQATSGGDMFLGNVDSLGSLDADASGFGGGFFADVDGGDGIGGTVNVFASGDGTLTVAGSTFLRAEGWGGGPSDCFQCGLAGGIGDAGTINVQAHSGAASKIDLRDVLFIFADGHGGDGQVGGLGLGGNVVLSATGGARVDVASDVSIAASGLGGDARGGTGNGGNGVGGGTGAGIVVALAEGGTLALNGNLGIIVEGTGGQSDGGTGGTGTGGEGRLLANAAGTITVAGIAAIDASGIGGAGVTGGAGIGGSPTNGGGAFFNGNGGTLTITGLAGLTAGGQGGTGSGGAGGNATGGRTGAGAFGGTAHFMNNLFMDASAVGGDGDVGGDATALRSDPSDELAPTAVGLFAQNGGTTTVDGITVLSAEAVGGNGANGNGGDAQGGEVDAFGYIGNMSLQSLAIDVNGYGGDGGNGGAGGAGNGGVVDLTFGFEDASIGGTISLASATITADGEGGDGGAGIDGTSGGNGGAGGDGTGGDILFAGSAAGGTINSGFALVTAYGRGGIGGSGGAGSTGPGGNGGAGGIGTGGAIQTGTISSELALTTGGGASYTTLSADSSAFGGAGGDGGTGAGGNGAGGNGGGALGGRATFLARGVLVTADSVTLTANANGGDGGSGSAQGNGGNARTGVIGVESKDRFNHADQRGTLEVDTIVGSAIAVGGTGAANGTSSAIGSSFFRVANGDATIGSVDLNIAGSTYDNSFISSMVSVRDGTAAITGDFSFTTTGHLVLDASLGSMTAGTINLGAGTFVPYTFDPPQAGPGSYSADSFSITTGGDFITNAHLISGSSLDIVAPGLIDMRDATAATTINLEAVGNIGFGDVTADSFDFTAGGAVDGGDILAATQVYGEAEGAITLDNISVGIEMEGGAAEDGFAVGIVSATSINVLDVEADESIGFATFGPLTTGDLNAGGSIMTLASGDISVGAMTTDPLGEIYMADSSMFTAAGGPDEFIPSLVLNEAPVPTGGSITLGGPVSTGSLRLAAGNLLSINGSIVADGSSLMSGDIALTSGVTVSGFTNLTSINSQGTFIGDGLSGTGGYRLSNAEYNQFLQDVSFEVRPDLGAAPTLTIGDLDIAGGIGDADFGIEDEEDNNLGTIRIVGDLVMHNGETGDLSFESETFQVDAATGSVVISSDGTTPGGQLTIDANHVHVAEGAILDQLAENPQYEGYQDDLNAPAEVQRPDGVIRASIVNLEFGDTPADLYTLYVQNTGTSETPAGFVITDLSLDGDGEGGLSPNSLDVVINGQIETGEGTLTGVDVRDALVEAEEGDLTPFTTNSTINGCLLVGPCSQQGPFPPDFTPTPGIQQEIVLLGDDPMPPPPFGNEDVIDDNDEETEDNSPIVPPQPLFDTSELGEAEGTGNPAFNTPMRSHPGLLEKGDVDDPVSGGGNPGLMEAGETNRPGGGSAPPAEPTGNEEGQP